MLAEVRREVWGDVGSVGKCGERCGGNEKRCGEIWRKVRGSVLGCVRERGEMSGNMGKCGGRCWGGIVREMKKEVWGCGKGLRGGVRNCWGRYEKVW